MTSQRPAGGKDRGRPSRARPYLGVMFDCCRVYQRVYRDRDGSTYRGRCPRCLRTITFVVGPDGTQSRVFRAR